MDENEAREQMNACEENFEGGQMGLAVDVTEDLPWSDTPEECTSEPEMNAEEAVDMDRQFEEKPDDIAIIYVRVEDLIPYPDNKEDVEFTEELELSINENGFTTVIEVTDYGMEAGKYMILSGHRRLAAVLKLGTYDKLPCIVFHYDDEAAVKNHVLMAQSSRDTAKDPLLYARRVLLHFKYLEMINYKGAKREMVARRLGISTQQVDRYRCMDRIIKPVWNLIAEEKTTISAVQPLAPRSEEEQNAIYERMMISLMDGTELTRSKVRDIIEMFDMVKEDMERKENEDNENGEPVTEDAPSETPKKEDHGDEETGLESDNEEEKIPEEFYPGFDAQVDEESFYEDEDEVEAEDGFLWEEHEEAEYGEVTNKIINKLGDITYEMDSIFDDVDEKKLADECDGALLIDSISRVMEVVIEQIDYLGKITGESEYCQEKLRVLAMRVE